MNMLQKMLSYLRQKITGEIREPLDPKYWEVCNTNCLNPEFKGDHYVEKDRKTREGMKQVMEDLRELQMRKEDEARRIKLSRMEAMS